MGTSSQHPSWCDRSPDIAHNPCSAVLCDFVTDRTEISVRLLSYAGHKPDCHVMLSDQHAVESRVVDDPGFWAAILRELGARDLAVALLTADAIVKDAQLDAAGTEDGEQ